MRKIFLILSLFIFSCDEEDVRGCTDSTACNFNPDANIFDDSCLEVDGCGECGGDGPQENFDCEGNCIAEIDCTGECGGSAQIDECDACIENVNDNIDEWNQSCNRCVIKRINTIYCDGDLSPANFNYYSCYDNISLDECNEYQETFTCQDSEIYYCDDDEQCTEKQTSYEPGNCQNFTFPIACDYSLTYCSWE